jgi:cytochrome c oxidase subunit IV
MTEAEKRELWKAMRGPSYATAVLVVLLGVNVLLGSFVPFRHVWIVEAAVVLGMVLTVLLVSMELTREPPVIRFFAAVGFCWVGFLFSITAIDYLTR